MTKIHLLYGLTDTRRNGNLEKVVWGAYTSEELAMKRVEDLEEYMEDLRIDRFVIEVINVDEFVNIRRESYIDFLEK